MSKYRKIDPRIWNDEHFRPLSRDAKLLFLFLLTHPHLTSLGAMRATPLGLACELGWTEKEFRKAFGELLRKPFLKVCESASFIGIPNFIKYNPPENPNVIKSWASALDYIPECDLKYELMQYVKAFAIPFGKAFVEALPKAFDEPFRKGMPNHEHEQEHEQEHKVKLSSASQTCEIGKLCNGKFKECSEAFEQFWSLYPRHDPPRKETRKKWCLKFCTGMDQEKLFFWLEDAKDRWPEKKYIPQPTTWLHQERWKGDLPPLPLEGKPKQKDYFDELLAQSESEEPNG